MGAVTSIKDPLFVSAQWESWCHRQAIWVKVLLGHGYDPSKNWDCLWVMLITSKCVLEALLNSFQLSNPNNNRLKLLISKKKWIYSSKADDHSQIDARYRRIRGGSGGARSRPCRRHKCSRRRAVDRSHCDGTLYRSGPRSSTECRLSYQTDPVQ